MNFARLRNCSLLGGMALLLFQNVIDYRDTLAVAFSGASPFFKTSDVPMPEDRSHCVRSGLFGDFSEPPINKKSPNLYSSFFVLLEKDFSMACVMHSLSSRSFIPETKSSI
jgi:hypothetical protein